MSTFPLIPAALIAASAVVLPTLLVDGQAHTLQLDRLNGHYSCGPACLSFLVEQRRWSGVQALSEPACDRPGGWSLQDLSDSATAMRWQSESYRCDSDFLESTFDDSEVARILHVNGGHYILVYCDAQGRPWIFDPQIPATAFNYWSFMERYEWEGVLLLLRRPCVSEDVR